MKLMLIVTVAITGASAFLAQGAGAYPSTTNRAAISMSSYADYMASRASKTEGTIASAVTKAITTPVFREPAARSTGAPSYAEYMSRQAKVKGVVMPVVNVAVAAPAARSTGAPSYAEYMSRQAKVENTVAPAVTEEVVAAPAARSTGAPSYAEYMSRQAKVENTVAPAVTEEVVATPAARSTGAPSYAEYMAKQRSDAVAPAATSPAASDAASSFYDPLNQIVTSAPPALVPKPAVAPVAKKVGYNLGESNAYNPWKDDELTVVTFMVNGMPKQYRIVQ